MGFIYVSSEGVPLPLLYPLCVHKSQDIKINLYGNAAQLRLRVSATFLPHFRSSKNGEYIQNSPIFGTMNWDKNSG